MLSKCPLERLRFCCSNLSKVVPDSYDDDEVVLNTDQFAQINMIEFRCYKYKWIARWVEKLHDDGVYLKSLIFQINAEDSIWKNGNTFNFYPS